MKNKFTDLNNHLFAQIERLSEEGLTPEQIEQEAKRGAAIVSAADQVINIGKLQLMAAKLVAEEGEWVKSNLPMIEGGKK